MLDSDLDLGQGLRPRVTDGSRTMIKPHNTNTEFELGGINHVALVCSDMARTVDFYSNILGMPLIKSLDLPAVRGSTSSSTPATATVSRSSGSPTRPIGCRVSRRRAPSRASVTSPAR